jgi:hypothetical protein
VLVQAVIRFLNRRRQSKQRLEELLSNRQEALRDVLETQQQPSQQPADGLDGFTLKQLKERCRQQGLKGTSNLKKAELIARLRAAGGPGTAESAPLMPGAPPTPAPAISTSPELEPVQVRLDRLEGLLLRIAKHLGVG